MICVLYLVATNDVAFILKGLLRLILAGLLDVLDDAARVLLSLFRHLGVVQGSL